MTTDMDRRLTDLVRAASAVLDEWERLEADEGSGEGAGSFEQQPHPVLDALNAAYPDGLPSFDEFVLALGNWRDAVRDAK